MPLIITLSPIPNALTVFTDGSGKTGTASVIWTNESALVRSGFQTTQRAELGALIVALESFPNEPLNILSDSAYAVFVCRNIEIAYTKPSLPPAVYMLFDSLLRQRSQAVLIGS